jgi:hypothetical protein
MDISDLCRNAVSLRHRVDIFSRLDVRYLNPDDKYLPSGLLPLGCASSDGTQAVSCLCVLSVARNLPRRGFSDTSFSTAVSCDSESLTTVNGEDDIARLE